MARMIAVFYTPDDDCEHAVVAEAPVPGANSGVPFLDRTFSPSRKRQADYFPALAFTPPATQRAIAGAFCPFDNRRYLFITDGTNASWTRYASPYNNQSPAENLIDNTHPLGSVGGNFPGVVDMAAHFNGGQLELAVLTKGGGVQIFRGTPWNATSWGDAAALAWTSIPVGTSFPTAKRVATCQGAGWGHVFLASDSTVTEFWYTPAQQGHVQIATFADRILDVGAVFTPDGIMHAVVATIDPNSNDSIVYEVEYVPAQKPPATRRIGTVNFLLDGLGAYIKPDNAQHIIMSASSGVETTGLFLSWGAPDLSQFFYGPWPGF